MKTSRYATSRQKACQACVTAKAKCDRKDICCGRCAARGLSCAYPQSNAAPGTNAFLGGLGHVGEAGTAGGELDSAGISVDGEFSPRSAAHSGFGQQRADPNQPSSSPPSDVFDFSGLELVCPINADGISIRWMQSYIPTPGQTAKGYQPSTIMFMRRMLKSYTSMAVRGRGIPPFIHPSQMSMAMSMSAQSTSPSILATCLSLMRICDKTLSGGSTTDDVVAEVLMREMNRLYGQHSAYESSNGPDMAPEDQDADSHIRSLSIFQAYLLYSMVLFFQLEREADPFLREAIIALQDIACASARRGLVCMAEQEQLQQQQQQQQQRTRPRWEAWIVAEAKRRTLYTMYLFDSVLSAHDGLPSYLGTELRGLLAPGSKALWQAQNRADWKAAYNLSLEDWLPTTAATAIRPGEGHLRIEELWPIAVDISEADLTNQRRRVDQWLEGVDEFGTMLYAVTGCTHGG